MTKWCAECLDTQTTYAHPQQPAFDSCRREELAGLHPADRESLELQLSEEHLKVYREVNKLAAMYLQKFLAQTGRLLEDKSELEQLMWVYRLNIIPARVLKAILSLNSLSLAKAHFRRLCILTHPDKNSHPLAANAFRKLLAVWEELQSLMRC